MAHLSCVSVKDKNVWQIHDYWIGKVVLVFMDCENFTMRDNEILKTSAVPPADGGKIKV